MFIPLILIRLLTAHLITEGLCQLPFWKAKKFSKKFIATLFSWLLQGLANGFITYLFAGPGRFAGLIVIFLVLRIAINVVEYKKKIRKAKVFFIVKHSVYLLTYTVCWIFLAGITLTDIDNSIISMISDTRLWTVSLAYIILIWPAGSLIGTSTEFWRNQLKESNITGLAKAGLWLGRLERVLILTFVLLSKYDAIGFLITAKSIFRFSEIKNSGDRKEAEYILIGTMISFVVALLVGIFTHWIITPIPIIP